MTAKLRSRTRLAISVASDTDRDNARVLVSRHGFSYKSHKRAKSDVVDQSIVFDNEIAPGLFIPSKHVPDDLADEYRNIGGTLGVMFYGELKREMTLEEIRGLVPDAPEIVDRETLRMFERNSRRVPFDVVRLGNNSIEPFKLNAKARAELKRAIGKSPSDKFISDVETCIGKLLSDRELARSATPSKVQARISDVVRYSPQIGQ